MKRIILYSFLVIFSLSAFTIDPVSKPNLIPENKEHTINKDQKSASEEIVSKNPNPKSKKKQEVVVRERRRRHDWNGRVYYISGASILLIILIVIILAG